MLGALDFVTKKVETVTNDAYISADQVIMLTGKLLENYRHTVITLVTDNAGYQHCRKVTGYAAPLTISCTCAAAYTNQPYKHRIAMLKGEDPGFVKSPKNYMDVFKRQSKRRKQ